MRRGKEQKSSNGGKRIEAITFSMPNTPQLYVISVLRCAARYRNRIRGRREEGKKKQKGICDVEGEEECGGWTEIVGDVNITLFLVSRNNEQRGEGRERMFGISPLPSNKIAIDRGTGGRERETREDQIEKR